MTTYSFDSVEKQASYGLGLQMGQQLRESGIAPSIELSALMHGIEDALKENTPVVPVDILHQALIQVYEKIDKIRQEDYHKTVEQGEGFLQQNRSQQDIIVTESGLQYRVMVKGKGPTPTRQDNVRVHYHGQLVDGTIFDSSIERGQPAEFPVAGVIKGWTEALMMMPVGSKWQIYLPHDLAYGEQGAGRAIPPFSTLIFDVELLDIL